ncbi:hypothetical protein BDV23DRAFT_161477 [Aspergillus alliaceus]|uniref:Uncharacterized protein n=1 Tax=Petromyces alliaceus TaxID=209559 RepID=A0A5N7C0F8_PETAA|nr:hypothetical protein BDV23DRAFT_161477 [Aspergillus alliaceus]
MRDSFSLSLLDSFRKQTPPNSQRYCRRLYTAQISDQSLWPNIWLHVSVLYILIDCCLTVQVEYGELFSYRFR